MKQTIVTILFLALSSLAVRAQSIGLSLGQGLDINTQQLSIDYLFTKKTLNLGISFKAMTYNTESVFTFLQNQKENKAFDNTAKSKILLAGGLTLNYVIYTTRNFEFEGNLSAYLGGDGKEYIYYPELNFKQNFYLTTNTKLTIGEGLNYFIMKDYAAKYNPFLSVGITYLF